jgi:hypothetical protein
MTESEYELRSLAAVQNAWGKYEAETWDPGESEFRDARIHFVDDQLVVAITDGFEREFITCFHEHFDYPHAVEPPTGTSEGQRRLRYRDRLEQEIVGKMIRKLRWLSNG